MSERDRKKHIFECKFIEDALDPIMKDPARKAMIIIYDMKVGAPYIITNLDKQNRVLLLRGLLYSEVAGDMEDLLLDTLVSAAGRA